MRNIIVTELNIIETMIGIATIKTLVLLGPPKAGVGPPKAGVCPPPGPLLLLEGCVPLIGDDGP